MPRLGSVTDDVRPGAWQLPSVVCDSPGRSVALLMALVCLAFVADGASTLAGLASGGRELNPLVAGLSAPAYALSCVVRAAVGCVLLAATATSAPVFRRTTQLGCLALVVVKLCACLSNSSVALA